jgi:hypothetical protein
MSALRTLAVGVVFIAVIAAACGGGANEGEPAGTDPPAATTAAPTAPQTTAATGATDAPQPAESEPGASESVATVTIEGTSYVFGANGPAATCKPNFFGGFFAVLYSPDLGANFSLELWNEGAGDGEQVSAATMKVDTGGETLDLDANPEMSWPAAELGSSYVGDFSYEGHRAEGMIYFINSEVAYDASLAPLDPIVAEFEVVCADG